MPEQLWDTGNLAGRSDPCIAFHEVKGDSVAYFNSRGQLITMHYGNPAMLSEISRYHFAEGMRTQEDPEYFNEWSSILHTRFYNGQVNTEVPEMSQLVNQATRVPLFPTRTARMRTCPNPIRLPIRPRVEVITETLETSGTDMLPHRSREEYESSRHNKRQRTESDNADVIIIEEQSTLIANKYTVESDGDINNEDDEERVDTEEQEGNKSDEKGDDEEDSDEMGDDEEDSDEKGDDEEDSDEMGDDEEDSDEMGDDEEDSDEKGDDEEDSNERGDDEEDSNEEDDEIQLLIQAAEIRLDLIELKLRKFQEGDKTDIFIQYV